MEEHLDSQKKKTIKMWVVLTTEAFFGGAEYLSMESVMFLLYHRIAGMWNKIHRNKHVDRNKRTQQNVSWLDLYFMLCSFI